MNKPVVAVFFGGMSSEHDISCRSAVTVAGGLDREKYDMVLVGITKEGKWLLVKDIDNRLADRDINLELTDEAMQHIIDAAYDPVYGARPLKRYLQKHVETLAARFLLEDKVQEGETILIDVQDGKYVASVK